MPKLFPWLLRPVTVIQGLIMRIYQRGLKALGLIYGVVGLIFLLAPQQLLLVINEIHGWIQSQSPGGLAFLGEASPPTLDFFFVPLAFSMMMMLTITAFMGARSPQDRSFLILHLASKSASVLGFLLYFFKQFYFPYLLGAVVDSGVFLMVILLYRCSRKESC